MTRAMIFEGNSAFQGIIKNIFSSRFPAVELFAVSDAVRAMEKVAGFLPDLILIDLRLPGDNALDLTRKIKTCHPETTVIFLCSYDMPEYRETASRCGADYFMVKESPRGDYIALIESILSGRGYPMEKDG
jgi:DNA-binding NarL/FixJ family response regulator